MLITLWLVGHFCIVLPIPVEVAGALTGGAGPGAALGNASTDSSSGTCVGVASPAVLLGAAGIVVGVASALLSIEASGRVGEMKAGSVKRVVDCVGMGMVDVEVGVAGLCFCARMPIDGSAAFACRFLLLDFFFFFLFFLVSRCFFFFSLPR